MKRINTAFRYVLLFCLLGVGALQAPFLLKNRLLNFTRAGFGLSGMDFAKFAGNCLFFNFNNLLGIFKIKIYWLKVKNRVARARSPSPHRTGRAR